MENELLNDLVTNKLQNISCPTEIVEILELKSLNNEPVIIKGVNEYGKEFEVSSTITSEFKDGKKVPFVNNSTLFLKFLDCKKQSLINGMYSFNFGNLATLTILQIDDVNNKTIYNCPLKKEVIEKAAINQQKRKQKILADKANNANGYNSTYDEDIKFYMDFAANKIGNPVTVVTDGHVNHGVVVDTKGKIVKLGKDNMAYNAYIKENTIIYSGITFNPVSNAGMKK